MRNISVRSKCLGDEGADGVCILDNDDIHTIYLISYGGGIDMVGEYAIYASLACGVIFRGNFLL